ncbi:unnamed protein product [Natator depressus]
MPSCLCSVPLVSLKLLSEERCPAEIRFLERKPVSQGGKVCTALKDSTGSGWPPLHHSGASLAALCICAGLSVQQNVSQAYNVTKNLDFFLWISTAALLWLPKAGDAPCCVQPQHCRAAWMHATQATCDLLMYVGSSIITK